MTIKHRKKNFTRHSIDKAFILPTTMAYSERKKNTHKTRQQNKTNENKRKELKTNEIRKQNSANNN